ncbi:C6 transcription factor [Aspergillus heteromorphus CBS 117.55]|uniref:C6 transcription factor n=1 Tax=Aspergillus heteromorphus CBS 117.55 TaxID=1448321 RepID=A0A317VR62_9EURO|nr:C6 transcription factor [Aspergillus heteromorphus CBS 117.55]PWY75507.1 C6 transcription factor [Aspergillus heteromorphus CBS 117.55]
MPPSRRPRIDPIVRVRTGCWACRRRKKKCDEAKPICGGCVRNKLTCQWPSAVPGGSKTTNASASGSVDGNDPQHRPPVQEDAPPQAATPSSQRETSSSIDSRSTSPSSSEILRNTSPEDTSLERAITPLTPTGFPQPPSIPNVQELGSSTTMTVGNMLPRNMSMFPGHGPDSYQLLSHYLATTADCMANGSTPVNPFLVQIVPLAFSSDLLLQLVLTQSAAHRAFRSRKESDEVAQRHYTKALQLFRKGVTEFIDGKESNPLMLTVGALVMCFTETAKGDMNGTIFDHLTAANSLLIRLLAQSDTAVPKDLKDFVIEYYTYTAAVSMISIDARVSTQLLLDFELEQRARQLLQSDYVGNLCGCWLELLLLIPCIFDLGRQWLMHDDQPAMPTADDVAMFGSLQVQIMRWAPYNSVTPEVFLAGRIFQQAMLLYLYTSLGAFSRTENGMYQGMIVTAITDAMSYLDQLSATVRINSGLCWPIAVVGSCLSSAEHQESLRRRLTTMVNTFGLGNMQRTLLLLEHMWEMPLDEAGPWNICRAMQRKQIWISFA